jgi:hypothetical protein
MRARLPTEAWQKNSKLLYFSSQRYLGFYRIHDYAIFHQAISDIGSEVIHQNSEKRATTNSSDLMTQSPVLEQN